MKEKAYLGSKGYLRDNVVGTKASLAMVVILGALITS